MHGNGIMWIARYIIGTALPMDRTGRKGQRRRKQEDPSVAEDGFV